MDLEVELLGEGEPVVVIQTALTVDELRPIAHRTAQGGFRVIHYHRRGYAGSGPALRPRPSPSPSRRRLRSWCAP